MCPKSPTFAAMKKSILITGASGFIGSFLVEEALRRGFDTWAGIRHTSSRQYLTDKRIRLIELDLGNTEVLDKQLRQHRLNHGAWDVVIHCAGATKCLHAKEFERHNCEATERLIRGLREQGMRPRQFIYLSSLSIFGPIREAVVRPRSSRIYDPICENDTPRPNTAYGQSKLKTERYLKSLDNYPYLIFRPTGVYGPRERDYFLMARSINAHVDFAAGLRKQELTFVYVKDLVQAVFLGVEKGITGREYFVTDGQVYDSRTFSNLIRKELGKRWLIRIKAPLWLLRCISLIAEGTARLFGHTSTLNRDKYKIMKQRNWQCDIQPLITELGYRPAYPLDKGVKETIAWYKKAQWL